MKLVWIIMIGLSGFFGQTGIGELKHESIYLLPKNERVEEKRFTLLLTSVKMKGEIKTREKIMGKIFYLMGKSASGKDTIYKKVKEQMPELKTIVIYTTRPIREGEENGREYYFVGDKELQEFQEASKVIELREYNTVHGIWKYFTVDDGQFDCDDNYLAIGTLESYMQLRDYFGRERLVPLYIEVEDGLRLERALARERAQAKPKYEEMCRRFLADSADFSVENLNRAGITKKYFNIDMNKCIDEIILGICEKI